jgi:isochorismate synthase
LHIVYLWAVASKAIIYLHSLMAKTESKTLNGIIETCIAQKLPFVFYRLPGKTEVHFMAEVPGGTIKASEAPGFMFNPFLRNEKTPAVFIRKDTHFELHLEDLTSVKINIDDICGEDLVNVKATREEFCDQVKKAVKTIHKGVLEKVILSRVEKATVKEKNPAAIFTELCIKYSTAFVSLVVIPGKTVWLTASPELLVSLEGDRVKSVALAGTKPANKNIPWGEKEKDEQQMVTDYVYTVLINNCIDVQTSGPDEVIAGNIAHLKTEFSGTLNTGMYQILSDLHPTPAVCGLPRDKALDFIMETEKHQRKYYTGYLGPCNMNGKTEWYVNLRCAELFSDRANLFVGGGITADSDPEKEWNETIMKAQTLLNVIAPTIKIV